MTKKQIRNEFCKIALDNPNALYNDLTTAEKAIVIKFITTFCEKHDAALTVLLSELINNNKHIMAYYGLEFFFEV